MLRRDLGNLSHTTTIVARENRCSAPGIVKPKADELAGPIDGDSSKLISGRGVPIVWKEPGTGEKMAIVQLGSSPSPTIFTALEPAFPGQSFRYTSANAPPADITDSPTATNGTGRFLAYGSPFYLQAGVATESETATIIRLVATQDNPIDIEDFNLVDMGRPFDEMHNDPSKNFHYFSTRYLASDASTITESVNKFQVTLNNAFGELGKIDNGDAVDFAIWVANTTISGHGIMDLTPLGLGVTSVGTGGGTGTADFCDPPIVAGVPDKILGYTGTCSTPGYYDPPGSFTMSNGGSCILASAAANPLPSDSFMSIDWAAGIIVNRTSPNSIQVGAGVVCSVTAGASTADTNYNNTNPKNEMRFRSGLRLENTGDCSVDVYAGTLAEKVDLPAPGESGSVPDDELYTKLELAAGLRADRTAAGVLRLGTNSAYVFIRGTATGSDVTGPGGVGLSGVTALNGKLPDDPVVAQITDAITIKNGDTVYALYDKTAGATDSTRWRVTFGTNLIAALKGISGYSDSSGIQGFINDNGTLKWIDSVICNVSPP